MYAKDGNIIVTELMPMSDCPVRKKVMIEHNFSKYLEAGILSQDRDRVFMLHGGVSINVDDCNGWLPCFSYIPESKEPDRSQPPCIECGALTAKEAEKNVSAMLRKMCATAMSCGADCMYDWLKNLKPGDEVCVRLYGGECIEKVVRIIKTMIITESGYRFNKTNGRAVGVIGCSRLRIYELTSQLREEIEKKDICSMVRHSLESLGIENLREIKKIFDLAKQQKNKQ